MIFLTSPSSSEALADLGSAECSVLTEEAEKDTVLLLSLSCCGEMEGGRGDRGGRDGETCRHMAGSEMSSTDSHAPSGEHSAGDDGDMWI